MGTDLPEEQTRRPASMTGSIRKATTYLLLIAFASIAGAYVGQRAGGVIARMTKEPAWIVHGRCVGWATLFLAGAIGGPLGFARFVGRGPGGGHDGEPGRPPGGRNKAARAWLRSPKEAESEDSQPPGDTPQRGVKAILVALLFGGFVGLIVGSALFLYIMVLYFSAAVSPLGPGGWWPILPLPFTTVGGAFRASNSFIGVLWLIVAGVSVLGGALLSLFGTVEVGRRRFQVFRSHKR